MVQATWELEVVIDAVCTFVMSSVDGGGGVVFALLTKPEQPFKNAAEQLRITALTAHHHPLALIFTVIAFSGLASVRLLGRGVGARGNRRSVLPELRAKNRRMVGTITTGMEARFGVVVEPK